MIPKRIFYVWGAKEPKRRDVLACMQSWTQNCSEYEIIEINENSEQYFNFQQELENNKWFKTVYDNKMWAFVADYIRIIVLYKNEVKSFGCRDEQNVIIYNDIYIYPERVFIPFRFTESFSQKCIKNQTHTIHWWGASWIKPKFLNFLQNKHKKNVDELLKNEGYWRTFYLFLF